MATVMQWDFNLRRAVPVELPADQEVTTGGFWLGPGVWISELIPGVHDAALQVEHNIKAPEGGQKSKPVEKMG